MPLIFVPTPLGNLEDITFRAVVALKSATVVFCEDTRVAKKLLDLLSQKYNFETEKKRFISLHSHNEQEVLKTIDISVFASECIYLSDAGMPCISDPGAYLAKYLQENNIPYDVLPDPSAAVALYAASGFLDSRFLFYGFLPHKKNNRSEELNKLLSSEYPVIFYEAPHRIEEFFRELSDMAPDAEVFAAKEMTKLHQKYFRGSSKSVFEQIQNSSKKGEWAVAVKFLGQKNDKITLGIDEIKALDLPKKQAAKLIAKITGENPKELYEKMVTER